MLHTLQVLCYQRIKLVHRFQLNFQVVEMCMHRINVFAFGAVDWLFFACSAYTAYLPSSLHFLDLQMASYPAQPKKLQLREDLLGPVQLHPQQKEVEF